LYVSRETLSCDTYFTITFHVSRETYYLYFNAKSILNAV